MFSHCTTTPTTLTLPTTTNPTSLIISNYISPPKNPTKFSTSSTPSLSSSSRRTLILTSTIALLPPLKGLCLELRFTTPDLSLEDAQSGARIHAQGLVNLKDLVELGSWKETQKALRDSSRPLRQELYTIIQSRPGSDREKLRKIYFDLFNNCTKLDYAARDGDALKVEECYRNILVALSDFYSSI